MNKQRRRAKMETKKYKVALVGCGVISKNHLTALADLDNVEVVALCDVKTERAQSRRDEFKLNSKIYSSYEDMLKSEKLDSVHIATPHYLHKPMAIAALELGVNVFLEKPICISEAEIEELIEAEKKSDGVVCVCFQNRFNPSTKIAKRIIEEDGGALGGHGAVFWTRNESYYTESGWRGSMKTEGGGAMINQAIHTIDLLCEFIGVPYSVTATKANHHLKGVIDVEDSCEGMIKFKNGKTANFYATTACAAYDNTSIFIKTQNHSILITQSKIFVDGQSVEDEALNEAFLGKECYGNGHRYLIREFYNSLSQNLPVPNPLSSATYALKILLAAYRSNDNEIILDT